VSPRQPPSPKQPPTRIHALPDDSSVDLQVNTADLALLGTDVAFGYAFRVGLTMQNTNTTITVAGHPLWTRLARSRR
jgi:hypothetical protein